MDRHTVDIIVIGLQCRTGKGSHSGYLILTGRTDVIGLETAFKTKGRKTTTARTTTTCQNGGNDPGDTIGMMDRPCGGFRLTKGTQCSLDRFASLNLTIPQIVVVAEMLIVVTIVVVIVVCCCMTANRTILIANRTTSTSRRQRRCCWSCCSAATSTRTRHVTWIGRRRTIGAIQVLVAQYGNGFGHGIVLLVFGTSGLDIDILEKQS